MDPELFTQIRSICEHAGSLVQMGEDEFALSKYYEALTLVPDPKSDHSISTFIYTAIGEQYFRMKDYSEAGKSFLKAYKCPGGENIGQINFRIGQCLEECGERKKAQDFLCQAYLLDGEVLFSKANPKYYKIIRSEIEGTSPEDDELELLHESDDYDLIDDILRGSGAKKNTGGYSGYSSESADRDIGLYSRSAKDSAAGQQRTGEQPDTDYADAGYDWDGDEYEDEDTPYDNGQYDDRDDDYNDDYDDEYDNDDSDVDGYDDDGEDDGDDRPVRRGRRTKDSDEPGVWAKIVDKVRKFIDLFK